MRNKTLRHLIFFFSASAVVFFICETASAQKYSRIKFAKGSATKTVYGTLNSYKDRKIFKIKVLAGQALSLEQIAGNEDFRIITTFIKDPLGEDVTDMDASCNNRKEIAPTTAGDYTIEIVQCQKADEWKGEFKFRVTVK